MSILLFLSSLSYPTFVFSYFGRDGFVFWIFSFISLFFLFKDFISKEVTNNILIVIKLFFAIFMFIFLLISFVRFGSFEMVVKAILEYFGQQPYIFAEIFNVNLTPRLGLSSFSFISSIYLDSNHADVYLSELGSQLPLSWKFGTLLKNFYLDFGTLGSFIFLISISFLTSLFFLYKKCNFFKLYIFFAYTQILIQGVFYFRQYNDVGNLYLICLIIVAIFYRFIPCSVVIHKK
ncbi:hypothetical protein MZ018_18845 [Shewanella sp. JNE10-2]|uniref:hypothetical protein n=1 Tax=unclassified Shewanella TaxID=196818 RepID=UPI002003CF35|nr:MULTISPECIES: hypothetical protein [unclassified Shewanella]UPO26900.1 hypothetical protein MZ018_18845 [Shewanella sp. JNE10-2]UPO34096.1 hypothetical protein MZ097_13760 [Shewanella sp. JNE7]